jgi:hypothetical protein
MIYDMYLLSNNNTKFKFDHNLLYKISKLYKKYINAISPNNYDIKFKTYKIGFNDETLKWITQNINMEILIKDKMPDFKNSNLFIDFCDLIIYMKIEILYNGIIKYINKNFDFPYSWIYPNNIFNNKNFKTKVLWLIKIFKILLLLGKLNHSHLEKYLKFGNNYKSKKKILFNEFRKLLGDEKMFKMIENIYI